MPSKKKPAAKKTTTKKTPTEKAASKKTAPKKDAAKGEVKPVQPEAVETPKSTTKPKASELMKRNRQETPTIFKVSSRKQAPIVFTLEDVREILKKQKKEAKEAGAADLVPPARKAAAKKATPAPIPVPDALPTPQKSKHAAASLADILGFSIGPSSATPVKPPAPEIPKKFRPYYALLLELRAHVQESLGMHAEDTLKRSQKEDSGDISTSADAGTDNFDRDFALSVVSSEQEALREIEAAIKRVHNGTYGVCEITGETIAHERLEVVPFTRYSLEGQRQYELTARRRVSRSGASFLNEGGNETISYGDDDGDN